MENQLCKNCSSPYHHNFCSNCGQKVKTVRLDWHYIKDEANYTLLHFNKGLLYTIKELFTRPGETIREFIEGKRIKHYKPLLLVFVLAGISGFLSLKLDMITLMSSYNAQNLNGKVMEEYNKVMHTMFSHYAFMEILALPVVSFASWLAFKKWGYNYIENIIINCFATGQRLVFSIFCIVIYLIIPKDYIMKVAVLNSIATFGLTIWTYASLYKDKEPGAIILRILLFLFLMLLFFLIILIILTVLFAIYLRKSGKI